MFLCVTAYTYIYTYSEEGRESNRVEKNYIFE